MAITMAFGAGVLAAQGWTRVQKARADSNRVFELRVYHTVPGRLPALEANFRDHNVELLKKHGITSIGYWVAQDPPASENTFVFLLAHDSRAGAEKHWAEFLRDPDFAAVAKASLASGKMLDKTEATYLVPTDFSPLQ